MRGALVLARLLMPSSVILASSLALLGGTDDKDEWRRWSVEGVADVAAADDGEGLDVAKCTLCIAQKWSWPVQCESAVIYNLFTVGKIFFFILNYLTYFITFGTSSLVITRLTITSNFYYFQPCRYENLHYAVPLNEQSILMNPFDWSLLASDRWYIHQWSISYLNYQSEVGK